MIRQTLFFLICLGAFSAITAFVREEYGKASYYSDALHGRKTANGEKYDKNLLTAAHKSLPFGTLVRVTRLDTKASVVVRVNDRGPFREGYVIELSRRAAQEIDLIKAGVTKVKVDVIEKPGDATATASSSAQTEPAPRPVQHTTPATSGSGTTAPASAAKTPATPPATAKTGGQSTELYQVSLSQPPKQGFGVQVTTLYNAPNVFPEVAKLMKYWPGKVLVSMHPMPEATENTIYKLILGPVADRASADKLRKEAVKKGYAKCFVVDLSQL